MAKKKVRHVKDLGSVYFDSTSNRWVGQIENGRYANGRAKYKRFYSSSQDECIYKMKEFKGQTLESTSNQKHLILFKDYISDYLVNVKKNKLKPASYERDISTANNSIIPYIGGYYLTDLKTDIIQRKLINKLISDNYSNSTINKAFVLTNECLKYACHQDLISKNPCEFVSKPNSRTNVNNSKVIRFFDDDEIDRFISIALSKKNNDKYVYTNGYPLVIMIYTGLRIGEMLALKWSDVNLDDGFIRVHSNIAVTHDDDGNRIVSIQNSTKTKQSRIVHLTKSAKKYIEELKSLRTPNKNDFLILTNGKRDIKAVKNVYSNICKKANIADPQGLHTLRHTFASLMIRKGVDIKIISEMLGHSSVSFTYNTYVHLIEEEKAKVIQSIDI